MISLKLHENGVYTKTDGPPLKIGDVIMLVDRFAILEDDPKKETYQGSRINLWSVSLGDDGYATISEVVTH